MGPSMFQNDGWLEAFNGAVNFFGDIWRASGLNYVMAFSVLGVLTFAIIKMVSRKA